MEQLGSLPSLAGDLIRIHKAITRGLTVAATRGAEFIRDGFPDPRIQQGFALYVQTLTAVVSAHHLGEDEVAFPALKQKLPATPFGRLSADHVIIETGLERIKTALPDLAGTNNAAALVKTVESIKGILAVWTLHIKIEQTAFSAEAIAGAMTPEEQAAISMDFGKHAQEHVGAPFFALPFVLFNLTPADRAEMLGMMPKPVVDLIPGEWKDKWSPMKPFLLD